MKKLRHFFSVETPTEASLPLSEAVERWASSLVQDEQSSVRISPSTPSHPERSRIKREAHGSGAVEGPLYHSHPCCLARLTSNSDSKKISLCLSPTVLRPPVLPVVKIWTPSPSLPIPAHLNNLPHPFRGLVPCNRLFRLEQVSLPVLHGRADPK